uniref:NADH dehydrogenase subunit 6 n=1 Tax=Decipisagitta decipiens TaxID=366427 RepID=D3DKM6_9BILA|nr:NADH dehydrogenase subunit 6 [Decipisagitta decipiens]BAI68175.1 NADH dehydrogenase subunit 6 [Decipisagitta decipiens]
MTVFIASLILFNTSPLVLGFFFLLLLVCAMMNSLFISPWLAFILLLVYVGGLMVLFIYCLSSLKITHGFFLSFFLTFLLTSYFVSFDVGGFPFELYLIFSILTALAIVLFVVMLIVVNLVDPNAGALKAQ